MPLALFLHRRLRPVKPWLADLGTIGAFAYIFVGASGAAILATVGSSLVEAYVISEAELERHPAREPRGDWRAEHRRSGRAADAIRMG